MMGYDSRLTDALEIDPPLPWKAIKKSKFLPGARESSSIKYELEDTTRDTDEGQVTVIRAVAVIPLFPDAYGHGALAAELAEIGQEITTAGGSVVRGWLVRSGEDQGDVQRYTLDENGEVVTETARLTWPDGTEVALS